MANIKGTNRGELLRGTAAADRIQAMGGDDIIVASGGNDTIDGGLGTDTLDYSAWSGNIRVSPTFSANANNSVPGSGTAGKYDATGALLSSDSFSYIERIIATSGNDLVGFSAGAVWGGSGDDYLYGAQATYGGAGDDLISLGSGSAFADGGEGIDTLFWFSGQPGRTIVDLQSGTVTYPDFPAVTDTLVSIENVRGYGGNKQIYGTDGSNRVEGGYGSDLIEGRGGDDVLVGDLGRPATVGSYTYGFADRINGGAGNDLLSGDLDADVLTGGSGADTFVLDTYFGTDRITDFEDGVDTLALYGGLTITGWETRDTNGDGTADAYAALLSNNQAVIFDGYTSAPANLVSGTGLALHTEQFAIPDLADWSAATGWGGLGLWS